MKIARYSVCLIVVFGSIGGSAIAQTSARERSAGSSDFAVIGSGWTALAQGKADDAIKAADQVLARRPGDHGAVDLKIEALSATQPVAGLDAYERWLGATRIEDVFLLVPIARGSLEQAAAGQDRGLQRLALQALARSGDARAAARLQEADKGTPANDAQRALDGDAEAAVRLTDAKAAAIVPPQTLAKALKAAGATGAPMLRSLLKHPAAPVRMEAALSLGAIGATDAIPDLKAMMADPEVRSYAAVALTRLGDAEAESVVQELLQSSVLDMRVLGAQAYEGRGAGPWVQALMPALRDPNGLTRIRAAELLAPVAPEAANPVLLEASKDPNPVVRAEVLGAIERSERAASEKTGASASSIAMVSDLPTLRRLLRDADPTISVQAAGVLLTLVRTPR